MKRLTISLLLGLFLTMGIVVSGALGIMTFTNDSDISGKTSISRTAGNFQLAVSQLLTLASNKPIEGTVCENQYCTLNHSCSVTIPNGNQVYWTYGWIKFEEPKIGNKGKVTQVAIRFVKPDKSSSAMWDYSINANGIIQTINNPEDCYVQKVSSKEYDFNCNTEIYTSAYVRSDGYFCGGITPWNLKATIVV
jgi:hypothetical protein